MCADSVERIQLAVASLASRMHALSRRFAASKFSVQHGAGVLVRAISAAGREAGYAARQCALHAGKALEAAAEEARVRAAQLVAHAELLEREAAGWEGVSVVAVAHALLSCSEVATPGFTAIVWDSKAALHAVDAVLRIRDGVDPSLCIVRGEGALFYSVGDNSVTVVESIEAEDVCVSVEGAGLASVSVGEVGVVEVVYHVPEGRMEPVCVSMSVCGAVLAGSPWKIPCQLGDSAILASVAPERLAAFLRELSTWLPRRAYTLLYRGSRDGMTAAAFHGLCDGKGPTLVLVRWDGSVAWWVNY